MERGELLNVVKLSRILKDYQHSDALHALLNVHAAIDKQTFLTKSGDLLVVLRAAGVDYEGLDPSQLEQVTQRFTSSLRIFDENFRIYQYLLKRNNPPIPHGRYQNPVVQEAVTNRAAYLESRSANLFTVEIYFVVNFEGGRRAATGEFSRLLTKPVSALREIFSTGKRINLMEQDLERAREALAHKITSFTVQLKDTLHLEVLQKDEAYRFFRRLLNYAPYKVDAGRLTYDSFVDFQACDSALECYRDHLRLDNYHVQVLTLKEPPAQTFAHLLKSVQQLPCNFIVTSEWKRQTNWAMRKLIQSKRRHFHNSKASLLNYLNSSQTSPRDMLIDQGAQAVVSELGACLEELEVRGNYFGEFSLILILYDEDFARLRHSVAECFKAFATHDAHLTQERYNLLNAWLAAFPGNDAYNLRRMWLSNVNYADLSFLFTLHTGEVINPHLGTEYLAVLETNHGTRYFLNLHYQDVAHTLVLGATGSGKSFLLSFLLTHLQKYEPVTFVFDLGGGYESLTRLFEGSYLPVGIEKRAFTINPFALAPTEENLHFLFSFIKVLVESSGYAVSAQEERDLYQQIESLYAIEPDQRRLSTLANILSRRLRDGLQKWVQGGQYGALFDNAQDNLTLSRFQAFDFEGMDRYPQVIEPLLFYILHRANVMVHGEELSTRFKVFVIDEAWRFLRHPTIKLYILEALKTWRKKNAAMILATQSSDDLLRSEMLPVIVESCATRMFLANPGMDRAIYREIFHLNDTEAELIANLVPKRQILIKRPDMAKVVNLNVDPKGYWLCSSNPYDNQKKREAFDRFGFSEGLEMLERSNP